MEDHPELGRDMKRGLEDCQYAVDVATNRADGFSFGSSRYRCGVSHQSICPTSLHASIEEIRPVSKPLQVVVNLVWPLSSGLDCVAVQRGVIAVESQRGQGATFTVTFPLDAPPP